MQKLTPFMYLKANINKLKFKCDEKYIPEYRRAFSAVLDRMDKYFIANNLYDTVDYQKIVEDIIAPDSKFCFYIDNNFLKSIGAAGVHWRYSDGTRAIGIESSKLGLGSETEGILCHEFTHHLTLGPNVLKYTKDGEKYEIQLPQNMGAIKIAGSKLNVSKGTRESLEAGSALDGGFICEALTELTKQEIYTADESFTAYHAQTSLISLLNELTGTKVNIQDFLRGDLPNYVQALGKANFNQFNNHCENFQAKFSKNTSIDYKNDADYIQAQDIICRIILEKIQNNPGNYSTNDVINIISAILAKACNPERYANDINLAIEEFANKQNLTDEEKDYFVSLTKRVSEEMALDKQGRYNIPLKSLDFSFKQTPTGFAVSFKNGEFFDSSIFPRHYSSAIRAIDGDNTITIEISEKGNYIITATNKVTNETQKISVVADSKQKGQLLIADCNSTDVCKLNFAVQQRMRDRAISTSTSLLNNFRHYDDIKYILSHNSGQKIVNISKVTAENGNEYLVVSSDYSSSFYRLTPNGYRTVKVIEQTRTLENLTVRQKIHTGRDNSGMIGYLETMDKTDEDSQTFKLEDGTTFFSYRHNGFGLIGEKITPFSDKAEEVYILSKEELLYTISNPHTKDIISSDSAWVKQEIRREKTQKEIKESKKAQEEEQRKLEQKRLEQQKERDKKLQEEREQQRLSREEQEKRQKKIEKERITQSQREKEKAKHFEQMEKKVKEKAQIYDEFGVETSNLEEVGRKHNNGFGRGR